MKNSSIPKIAIVFVSVSILLAILYVVISPVFQGEREKPTGPAPADTRSAVPPAPESTNIDSGPANSVAVTKPALSLSETYKAYLFERELCQRVANLVSKHDRLPKLLQDRLYVERRDDFMDLLFDGPLKDRDEIRYLKAHQEYFGIDTAFHGGPGFVYLTKSVPIYCVQRDKRMKELEFWGPSKMSWDARQAYLSAHRDVLTMPWYDAAYGVPFEYLDSLFQEASKIYSHSEYRPLLAGWVTETEAYLIGQGKKYATDGGGGRSRTEQLEEIQQWVARLRGHLK